MRLEYESGSSPSGKVSLRAVCCGSAAVGCWVLACVFVLSDGLPFVQQARAAMTRRSGEFVWLVWPEIVAILVTMGIGLLLAGNLRWWMDLLNAALRSRPNSEDFEPGELDRLIAEGEADIDRGAVMELEAAYELRRAERVTS